MSSPNAQQYGDQLVGSSTGGNKSLITGADLVPGLNMGLAGNQAYRATQQGNYGEAAVNAAGMVPLPIESIFAGPMAKTADHVALSNAMKMAEQGSHPTDIWNQTGWFQGADSKWRFEIPDNRADIHTGVADNLYSDMNTGQPHSDNGFMTQVLNHPELYKNYPQLGNVRTTVNSVDPSGPASASFNYSLGKHPETEAPYAIAGSQDIALSPNTIYPNSNLVGDMGHGSPTELALHELQHGVQQIEGFTPGSTVEKAQSYQGADETPWQAYQRTAGEVEARNVETRRPFTPGERQRIPPWETQDIPPDTPQIVLNPIDHDPFASAGSETQSSVKTGMPQQPVYDKQGNLISGQPDPNAEHNYATLQDENGNQTPGFIAYHGSPHDFDQFDINHNGEGEGYQLEGHGLYFSQIPDIAQIYKDNLATNLDPGVMYQTHIAADPNKFLDWNKSYFDQHPNVQKSLDDAKDFYGVDSIDSTDSGEDIYYKFLGSDIDDGHISEDLDRYGIHGVKFKSTEFDPQHNPSGPVTHNYVLFHHKPITILKKTSMVPVDSDPFA